MMKSCVRFAEKLCRFSCSKCVLDNPYTTKMLGGEICHLNLGGGDCQKALLMQHLLGIAQYIHILSLSCRTGSPTAGSTRCRTLKTPPPPLLLDGEFFTNNLGRYGLSGVVVK